MPLLRKNSAKGVYRLLVVAITMVSTEYFWQELNTTECHNIFYLPLKLLFKHSGTSLFLPYTKLPFSLCKLLFLYPIKILVFQNTRFFQFWSKLWFHFSVLISLKETDKQWIIDLLNAFNAGNVHLFETMKAKWVHEDVIIILFLFKTDFTRHWNWIPPIVIKMGSRQNLFILLKPFFHISEK